MHVPRHTKICYFALLSLANQDVSGGQIAMNNLRMGTKRRQAETIRQIQNDRRMKFNDKQDWHSPIYSGRFSGVHLLKFTLDTHPGLFMHYLGLLEFPLKMCDAFNTHITTHTRCTLYLIYHMAMIAISSLDFL